MTTEPMQQFLARKQARRKALAALPVGEKLRMLEEMQRDLNGLRITPAPKPVNPVRSKRQ